jgi:hypothetical protein
MPRSIRIQLVAGLVVGVVGLAIAYLGPFVAWFAVGPDLSALSPEKLGGPLEGIIERMLHFGKWQAILVLGGMGLTAAGFLYSFAVWADWFVGKRNPENKPAASA